MLGRSWKRQGWQEKGKLFWKKEHVRESRFVPRMVCLGMAVYASKQVPIQTYSQNMSTVGMDCVSLTENIVCLDSQTP